MQRLVWLMGLCCYGFIFLSTGCTRTIAFKLVDGYSNTPLHGVKATLNIVQVNIAVSYSQRRVDGGDTDGEGIVVARDIPNRGSYTTTVTFDKEGFYEAGAYYTGVGGIGIESRVPDTIAQSGFIYVDSPADTDVVIVKMFPADAKEKDLELHNWRR